MSDFSTPSDIVSAFANTGTYGCRSYINKLSMTAASAYFYSTWLETGTPPPGVAPTTWAIPTQATIGAWNNNYINPASGTTARLLLTDLLFGVQSSVIFYDRLGHMASLSGTVLTAQTTGASLTTPSASGRCSSTGADVTWGLEWYIATGSTAVTATITYTNQSGASGKTTTVGVSASTPAGRFIPITALASGDTSIQSVDSVTLSASTLTTGNFGVSAYKFISQTASYGYNNDPRDWARLSIPQIANNACLCPIVYAASATIGPYVGSITIGSR